MIFNTVAFAVTLAIMFLLFTTWAGIVMWRYHQWGIIRAIGALVVMLSVAAIGGLVFAP